MEDEFAWPLGSSPVKDAYWVIANVEGKIVDANGFIIPSEAEIDEEDDDSDEDECSCGYYCMDCLGMSYLDFM